MEFKLQKKIFIPLLLCTVIGEVMCRVKPFGCLETAWQVLCNADNNEIVQIVSVAGSLCPSVTLCSQLQADTILTVLTSRCASKSSCQLESKDLGGSICSGDINFECIPGPKTTARSANTTPRSDRWQDDYGTWQWAIIWIVIGVVVVAIIIITVMLINKLCFKAFHREKPKFVETAPAPGSQMGSTMNLHSRSVSMSTLQRPPPAYKRDVSQEEIEEVRAQFGTNKKKEKPKYMLPNAGGTIDSRRSSGDGASGGPNGKYQADDDSSSGIGSGTYDSRLKHAMYDDADTSHDDYVAFTMKKQAKSVLVNPTSTLVNPKKVDTDLYKQEAPTVDIHEDQREETFRIDINSWELNAHQKALQDQKVTVDIENETKE